MFDVDPAINPTLSFSPSIFYTRRQIRNAENFCLINLYLINFGTSSSVGVDEIMVELKFVRCFHASITPEIFFCLSGEYANGNSLSLCGTYMYPL